MGVRYKNFDVIMTGELLTSEGESVDKRETHRQADMTFAHQVKMYGKTLAMDMLKPELVGESLVELAEEYEKISKELEFKYE
jgi:hypothetical protein